MNFLIGFAIGTAIGTCGLLAFAVVGRRMRQRTRKVERHTHDVKSVTGDW